MANLIQDSVDATLTRLEAHPDVFAKRSVTSPPIGEAAMARIEEAIGLTLPEPLRSFYVEIAASLHLSWRVRDEAAEELGLDDPPSGQLEIVSAEELPRHFVARGRPVLRFVNDGHGDGWALDLERANGRAMPVVWSTHDGDAEEALGDTRRSGDAMIKAWTKTGFVHPDHDGSLEDVIAAIAERRENAPAKAASKKQKSAVAGPLARSARFAALGARALELPPHRTSVRGVAAFADGARALTVGEDGDVRVVDLANGEILARAVALRAPQAVAVDPASKRFAIGGAKKIQVFTIGEAKSASIALHNVSDLVFHPDGERLLAVGGYGKLHVFHVASGRELSQIWTYGATVRVDQAGRAIVLGAEWKKPARLYVIDVDRGEVEREIVAEGLPEPKAGCLVIDGGRAVLPASAPAGVAAYDLATGETLRAAPTGSTLRAPARMAGRALVVSRGDVGIPRLEVWDPENGTTRARLELPDAGTGPAAIWTLDATPDGLRVIGGSSSGFAFVADVAAFPPV